MNSSLRYWWRQPRAQQLIRRYQALAPREQTLLQITLHAVVLFLLLVLVLEPGWNKLQRQWQTASAAQAETRQLQELLHNLQQQEQPDPDAALRQELAQLAKEQALQEQRIAALTDALVSPAQMIPLLQALLQQDERLQLISLTTLPQEPLQLDDSDNSALLFRHGLRLQLKATYAGLVDYQQRLDALPWRVYWQTLDYQVQQYPHAEVLLELYTFSLNEEMLGG